jgi:hypothetical protein
VVAAGCLSYVCLERPMTTFFKRVLFGAPKLPNPLAPIQPPIQESTPHAK